MSHSGGEFLQNTQHIAIVVPAIAREGITKQVAFQIVELQKRGCKVCLIVLATLQAEVMLELGAVLPPDAILVLGQKDAYLSPRAFFTAYRIVLPVLGFLKRHRIGHVIAHAPYAHFLMRLVKLFTFTGPAKFTLLQYFHGLQYAQFPVNTFRRAMVNKLNQLLARRLDDGHVFVSHAAKADTEAHFLKHSNRTVIYNTLQHSATWGSKAEQEWRRLQVQLNDRAEAYKILIAGRIEQAKGQFFFLNVLKRFVEHYPREKVVLFIAGDGIGKLELETQVRQEGLSEIVLFTGEVTSAALEKVMQQVDLLVMPSFFEGLGFVLLEALKARCLILASATGGIPEIVRYGETGYLFAAGDQRDCLQQLSFIFENRNTALLNEKRIEEELKGKFSDEENINKLWHMLLSSR